MKYFCRISVVIQKIKNNIDDIILIFDLFCDGLCFFLEGMMIMKELTLRAVISLSGKLEPGLVCVVVAV